jgi:hypothetical protein
MDLPSPLEGDLSQDFNVELSPEDEDNSELLEELAQLGIVERPEKEVDEELTRKEDAKKRAISLKRSGDLEGARQALLQYESLCSPSPPKVVSDDNVPSQQHDGSIHDGDISEIEVLKRMALEAKKSGDMQQARVHMGEILRLQGKSKPSIQEIMKMMTEQVRQCQEAIKIYTLRGNKVLAAEFKSKKDAFENDIGRLKGQQKSKTIEMESVSVELPVDLTNENVSEDQVHLIIKAIRLGARSKLPEKDMYFVRATIEWPPSDPHHKKQTEATSLNDKWDAKLIWSGCKAHDFRTIKFFEHHKLRVELVKIERGFWRTKEVTMGYALIRMNGLVSIGKVEQTADLHDEMRKSLGISIELELRSRTPLAPKMGTNKKIVNWSIWSKGEVARLLNLNSGEEDDTAEQRVKHIASYVVLEYEIGRLKSRPESTTDPALMEMLFALENKLEELTIQVDVGQLSMEKYLERVRMSIVTAKQNALACKQSGKMEEARNWLHHVHLMESEIAEADDAE